MEMSKVKTEYDPARDLLHLWFGTPSEKAAQTGLRKGKYVERDGLCGLRLAVEHTAGFLGSFSTKRRFATMAANSGRDVFYQNKFAINHKNLIDQL
jgi:hypothetical protein